MFLPSTSELIKKYGIVAKKSLGQNFILDSNITNKIVKYAGNLDGYIVIEIGPGPGNLTRSILENNPKKLISIEMDKKFLPLLEEISSHYPDRLQIVIDDALTVDELDLVHISNTNPKFKIIANLPYNIGTELLFKWVRIRDKIDSIIVMLQKEVVARITAKSGSKQYGRLSVMMNFLFTCEHLFDVQPTSFVPQPSVVSSVVKLVPRSQLPIDVDVDDLSRVCRHAFGQRRKMIKSSLKEYYGADVVSAVFKKHNIDATLRAEQLSLEQFGLLAAEFAKISKNE